MPDNAHIQIELAFQKNKIAGYKYTIDTTVTYDPIRSYVEIDLAVSREGFDDNMPVCKYEQGNCPNLSADKIADLVLADGLVWSQAVAIANGNQNAERILHQHLGQALDQATKNAS
ncbi:MAG: hypothetical protein JJU29_17890 [Verrucomicrobia bacterium]|nr:hypothetical protein [Verrucomicrobiota bacterium]